MINICISTKTHCLEENVSVAIFSLFMWFIGIMDKGEVFHPKFF